MEASIGVNLRVTAHSNQGGRKYMEDMFCVAYQPTADDRDLLYAYFGIFDGHGGREAALYAKHHLMDFIVMQKNFWSDDDELVLKAIREGFLNTHYAMWRELDKWPKTPSGLPSTSGTTASVAFVRRGKLYIGHVGDSGIVMGYEDPETGFWRAKPLTKDHKPETPAETARISQSGGKVIVKSGVHRVVWNRPRIGHKGPVRRSTMIDEIPFLAVARSLGDLWSYNSEQDEFVVSPCPDVSVLEIDVHSHRCLILGTDGLWNMLTPQDAVNSVYFAEKNNEKQPVHLLGPNDPLSKSWINPSKRLVDRALDRWMQHQLRADNTSVVTVVVDPPGPPKVKVRGHSSSLIDPTTSPVGISRYAPQPTPPATCNYVPACPTNNRDGGRHTKVAVPPAVPPTLPDKSLPGVPSQPRASPTTSHPPPESSPVSSATRATTRAKRRGVTRRGDLSLPESSQSESHNRSINPTNSPQVPGSGPGSSSNSSSAFYPVVTRHTTTKQHSTSTSTSSSITTNRNDPGQLISETSSTSSEGAEVSTDDVQINEISSSSEPNKINQEDGTRQAPISASRTRKGGKDVTHLSEPASKKRRAADAPSSKPNTRHSATESIDKASTSTTSTAAVSESSNQEKNERFKKNSENVNQVVNPTQARLHRKMNGTRSNMRSSSAATLSDITTDAKSSDLSTSVESVESLAKSVRKKKITKKRVPAMKQKKVLQGRVMKKASVIQPTSPTRQVKKLTTQPLSPRQEQVPRLKRAAGTLSPVSNQESRERSLRSTTKSALRVTRSMVHV